MKNVVIIFGGKSAEHEVSLKSATNIFNTIDRTIFRPVLVGIDKNGNWNYSEHYQKKESIDLVNNDFFSESVNVYISNFAKQAEIINKATHVVSDCIDIAFPIIHGTFGEDGTLQGFLKTMNIPFVGCDILASSVGMDKEVTKRLLRDANIPISKFYTLYRHLPSQFSFEEVVSKLKLPLFIKPANAGSSVGVSKVTNKDEYETALSEAFKFDNKILIEEAIIGKEVECAILGNEQVKASVVGEIVPTKDFYSYDAKYISSDGAKLKIPADIDEVTSEQIREYAIKGFKTICGEGMARVDFFLRPDNAFVLNEINTLPGFTEISMYPKLWEYTGIPYKDLITELINLALQKHKKDSKLLKKI
ncbi:D-alanine--D-alanine ligase [Desulfobulbus sp.]|uniref:D-alanine--D-alanine ligase n=1 Tax=Desulfobulbus sp. TaxID=895 RepID=UPI00286F0EA3|nr:D-alanine--D-alanine ligase [Desulfobulbus sp.]